MTREEELQALIEEQRRDDSHVIFPERHVAFSLDGVSQDGLSMSNLIGVDEDGEIVSFLAPKSALGHSEMIGVHGTEYSYGLGCHCAKCKSGKAAAIRRWYHSTSEEMRERMRARDRRRYQLKKHDPEWRARKLARQRAEYQRKKASA